MSKVQLAVGQVWKTRAGDEVAIIRKNDDTFQIKHGSSVTWPYIGSNNISYTDRGTVWEAVSTAGGDRIELVQDENGWRPWKATADSQCPVADGTQVLVRLACGTASKEHDPRRADQFIWSELPTSSIVAYKIVEEASKPAEPARQEPPARRHSHYFKDVSQIDEIDVYRVCDLFEVDDPSGATQHAVKKLLCAGRRGAKDRKKDYQEAIDTLTRRLAMWEGE